MQKWVKALRSGKYKQTKMMLNNGYGGYCCLGVLCDISKTGKWNSVDLGCVLSYSCSPKKFATSVLPKKVMKWAGMKTESGELGDRSLTGFNDEGKSFKEISDIIEENYKKL